MNNIIGILVNKQSINGLKSNYILAKCTTSYELSRMRTVYVHHNVQGADCFIIISPIFILSRNIKKYT